MQLTNKSEYAFRALLHLGIENGNKYLLTKDVAAARNIPLKFLAQIVRDLRKAGLIDAARGPHGGIKLRLDPKKIRAFDIINAIEGDISLYGCVTRKDFCEDQRHCPICDFLGRTQAELIRSLKNTTLLDLITSERSRSEVKVVNSNDQ